MWFGVTEILTPRHYEHKKSIIQRIHMDLITLRTKYWHTSFKYTVLNLIQSKQTWAAMILCLKSVCNKLHPAACLIYMHLSSMYVVYVLQTAHQGKKETFLLQLKAVKGLPSACILTFVTKSAPESSWAFTTEGVYHVNALSTISTRIWSTFIGICERWTKIKICLKMMIYQVSDIHLLTVFRTWFITVGFLSKQRILSSPWDLRKCNNKMNKE